MGPLPGERAQLEGPKYEFWEMGHRIHQLGSLIFWLTWAELANISRIGEDVQLVDFYVLFARISKDMYS